MTAPKPTTYQLTLRDEMYYHLTVDASSLDAAIEIARKQWLSGKLDVPGRGSVVVFDENWDELANW